VCEYLLHVKFISLLDCLSIYLEDLRKYHKYSVRMTSVMSGV